MLKEWDDAKSWAEIVRLAHNPAARIIVVAKEVRNLWAVEREFRRGDDPGMVYSIATSRAVFSSGATLLLRTCRQVSNYQLRGSQLTAAYLIGSHAWNPIDADSVICELRAMFRRAKDANV